MKKNGYYFLFLALSLAICGLGCGGPSASGPSSNTTPTPNLTPVCGSTYVIPLHSLQMSDAGIQVIKNASEWNNFYKGALGYPTPAPFATPIVDFNSKMLITVGEPYPCSPYGLTVNSICVGPDHVVIDVTQSTCGSCPSCGTSPDHCDLSAAYSVSKSSLPVDIVYSYVNN